jgi:glutamyl-tRNA reductase
MHISLVGINHSTAPITIREKLAITRGRLRDSLSLLRHYVPHGIILSTCNRTEVYNIDSDDFRAEETSINFLKAHFNIPDSDWVQRVYVHKNGAAVEHLFRVASGLDSMIIGEFEILGQVKYALEVAEKARMVNLPLRHLFQSAIRTGRRVREETGISKNALSVSSVAVDLAAKIAKEFERCKMLVIGAGEAGRLVAKAAKEKGISQIIVVSRSQETGSALAETLGGISATLNNVVNELSTSHIVVTCSGAPHWILDVRRVEKAMKVRPELPLVIIDIGVPRNVEPEVGQINNVCVYNIDDLTEISNRNRQQREGEIQMATEIIAAEVDKFISWWQALEVRPIVNALMKKAEDIRRGQLNKTLSKLCNLSDEERDSLEAMTRSIATKILKDPVSHLKANANNNKDYIEMIRELFQLNIER